MPGTASVALGNHPIQIPSDFPGILKQYTKVCWEGLGCKTFSLPGGHPDPAQGLAAVVRSLLQVSRKVGNSGKTSSLMGGLLSPSLSVTSSDSLGGHS